MRYKRVLIVDDDEIIRSLVADFIQDLDPEYQLITASDGLAALDRLNEQAVDLILTDYNMPCMNGIELVQTVRQVSPDTRIVMMSGNGSSELRWTIEQLDLDGFLPKPFSPTQLQEVLKRTVEIQSENIRN